MKKHVVVMTFPANKFEEYGYCLKGFRQNWPESVMGYALVEGAQELKNLESTNLKVLEFNDCVGEQISNFEKRNFDKKIFDMSTTGPIWLQAAKFARKAFAQIYILENINADYVHYIDADLYTHRNFSIEMIEDITSEEFLVACLPRWWAKGDTQAHLFDLNLLHLGFTETGYIIWNKGHNEFKLWLELYKSCYENDKIFEFEQWHDCIAFDYATLKCMHDFKSNVFDLSFGTKHQHPLVVGPLGKYFDHMKGARKYEGSSPERVLKHGH